MENNYKKNFEQEIDLKLTKVCILRDYAVDKGLEVPDELLDSLNKIQIQISEGKIIETGSGLDKLIRAFSQIVSPSSFESIYALKYQKGKKDDRFETSFFDKRKFYLWIILTSIVSIIVGITAFCLLRNDIFPILSKSILAATLGLLGSLIFTVFNLLGEINERTFNPEDTFSIFLRILIGPLLGWLFFIVFAENAFDVISGGNVDTKKKALMFLPFLVGFSTRLVIGIINKLINVVELSIGIQDIDVLKRKKRIK